MTKSAASFQKLDEKQELLLNKRDRRLCGPCATRHDSHLSGGCCPSLLWVQLTYVAQLCYKP